MSASRAGETKSARAVWCVRDDSDLMCRESRRFGMLAGSLSSRFHFYLYSFGADNRVNASSRLTELLCLQVHPVPHFQW